MERIDEEKREKLLIVDDDPLSLKSLVGALGGRYELTVATNGADGLAQACADHRIFLLDLHLPDMSGFDILKTFKENPKLSATPIIFITSNQDVETEEAGIRLGAVDFITKPFSPPVLRARIRMQLELRRKTELLEKMAAQDGLTGIANRRRFDEILDLEWKRAAREGASLSLIVGDIDRFKSINDTYGHLIGDETLKLAARSMAAEIYRPGDFIARYGGEEFAVILSNTDLKGAVLVAERLRLAVAGAFASPSDGIPRGVTISMGCASLVPDGGDCKTLIHAADTCLAAAKQNGRNRVES